MIEAEPRVRSMFMVKNANGEPTAVCPTLADATTFARCVGHDAPLEAIKVLPIVEFAKRVGDGYE
jgi:hypothetical protein